MEIYNDNYRVYIHVNKINNKMYAGITKRELSKRFLNGKGYKDCPLFYNAIQKYGWNNFEYILFADNLTKDEACNMEKILISYLNLQDSNYGYNIKDGGNMCPLANEIKKKIGLANKGRKASENTRKKLSESHKGRKHTEDEKTKIGNGNRGLKKPTSSIIRKNLSGEKHHFYNKHLSENHKNKISEKLHEYYKTHEMKAIQNVKKKIIKIETNTIYNSIEEAAKDNNICRSSISECCSGKRKSAGGFHWKFAS